MPDHFTDEMADAIRPMAMVHARLAAATLIAKDLPKDSLGSFVSIIARLAAARAAEDYLLRLLGQLKAADPKNAQPFDAIVSMAASVAASLAKEPEFQPRVEGAK